MPTPLGEPFFLRGRTSVVQRSVIMSAVLSALTGLAAWLFAASILAFEFSLSEEWLRLGVPIAFATIVTLILYLPLNHWNRRTWRQMAIAAPVIAIVMEIAEFGLHDDSPDAWLPLHLQRSLQFWLSAAAGGLLQMRASRPHVLAYTVSLTMAAGMASLTFLLVGVRYDMLIAGFPFDLDRLIFYAAVFGGWMLALSIPWGLPFWWPPEQTRPDLTQPPSLPPTAP